jgi:tripartite-type tricarboxylate transporter receptor subunit TctC
MVLLLACAMVVTDFVRHPFEGAPPGSAATERRDVTLWVAGTDAGATPGQLAHAAARALDAPDARVRVRSVDGGVAAAVDGLLDDDTGADDDLLVVHAGTFADLQREQHDLGLPDLAALASQAERLLLRARPVTLLADDPLLVAATRRSRLGSLDALLGALRGGAGGVVLGVEGDPWSRNALAALIEAAGARGRVRYRLLPAENQAAFLARGAVDAVVTPASAMHRPAVAAQLRPLTQSDRGPRLAPAGGDGPLPPLGALLGATAPAPAPAAAAATTLSRWVAVVAAPSLAPARARALTRRLGALTRTARWRRSVARLGLGAPPRPRADLLASTQRESRRLTALADRLARGARWDGR